MGAGKESPPPDEGDEDIRLRIVYRLWDSITIGNFYEFSPGDLEGALHLV